MVFSYEWKGNNSLPQIPRRFIPGRKTSGFEKAIKREDAKIRVHAGINESVSSFSVSGLIGGSGVTIQSSNFVLIYSVEAIYPVERGPVGNFFWGNESLEYYCNAVIPDEFPGVRSMTHYIDYLRNQIVKPLLINDRDVVLYGYGYNEELVSKGLRHPVDRTIRRVFEDLINPNQ